MVYEILTEETWAERTAPHTAAPSVLEKPASTAAASSSTTSTTTTNSNATAESVAVAVADYFRRLNAGKEEGVRATG